VRLCDPVIFGSVAYAPRVSYTFAYVLFKSVYYTARIIILFVCRRRVSCAKSSFRMFRSDPVLVGVVFSWLDWLLWTSGITRSNRVCHVVPACTFVLTVAVVFPPSTSTSFVTDVWASCLKSYHVSIVAATGVGWFCIYYTRYNYREVAIVWVRVRQVAQKSAVTFPARSRDSQVARHAA